MNTAVSATVIGRVRIRPTYAIGAYLQAEFWHSAATIASGVARTVLITYGEGGRSGVGRTRDIVAPMRLMGHFEQPCVPRAVGAAGRPGGPDIVRSPVLRSMKTHGLSHETLAMSRVGRR